MIFKKKKKSDVEELFGYLYGDEFAQEILDEKNDEDTTKNLEKQKQLDSNEANFRDARKLVIIIVFISSILLITLSVIALYPKIFFYVGLVKKPTPLPVSHVINDNNALIIVGSKTTSDWQGSGFVNKLYYNITNKTSQFLYVNIDTNFMNGQNQLIENRKFMPAKEVIGPQESITGYLIWDNSIKAQTVKCTWNLSYNSVNIIDANNKNPSASNSTNLGNEVQKIIPGK